MRRTTLALAMMAGTMLTAHAAAETPLTPEDMFKVRHVGSVTMSPDGSHVAYTLSRMPDILNGEDNGSSSSEVLIATAAGQSRIYLSADVGAYSLGWKDETTLTYLASDDGKTALFTLDITGGAPQKLFSFDESIRSYDLADDGKVIFFSARDASDPKDKQLENMGFDANIIDEDYSFTRLYRYDATAGETTSFDLEGQVSSFDASADGDRVVVALAPTPLVGDDIINRTYHIIDGDDGDVQSVIDTKGKIGKAEFSPDGRRIAFLAGVDRQDPIAHTLAVANARNGEFTFLTKDLADQVDFAWADNGSLHLLTHRGTSSEYARMSLSGQSSGDAVHEGYVARSISAAGGSYAIAADAPDRPRALYVSQGGDLSKWTSHNDWLADKTLGNQEVVTWTARDGIEVEGLLITPKGRKPSRGWPMITVVHGGPEAHYSNGWVTGYSTPGHFGATSGYAVFYPNYRGSTGRGVDFAKLDHLDPPAAEFNDIVDGIEALAEAGTINKDKVGITGGSYGGYASAWGATALSEHFAAAVVFVALTDLISFSGTTDIPEEMSDSHFQMYPEGNWQTYLEQSPVYHAANSKTPTLILHGEADPRVHPSQSLELFRYLKRVGQAPVRLVTYPGEGHGNRRAAAQYDYSLRLMRWMDTFLKGDAEEMPGHDLDKVRALAK
ncbi:S9 family peptidase [Parvularcula marina]|uniref:S9 family peptidase n=1 Tax=Parvularcula marina TaxID=2292771 RepID=A0A371RGN5_9PROT|nr:S9 family peptidase [Parvularcula marina]RFB04623.1 S9 family peptidase [Parvularcula marina]